MHLKAYLQSLIGQALLGTDRAVLDCSLLPDNLRQTVEDIAKQGHDAPTTLLQQIAFVISNDRSNQTLEVNSFSLPKTAQYQSLVHKQTNQGGGKSKTKKVALSADEQELLDAVQAHNIPVPLLPVTFLSNPSLQQVANPVSFLPTFPQAINDLVKQTEADPTGFMLFWLLKNLSVYNMQFSVDMTAFLYNAYMHLIPEHRSWGLGMNFLSRYMLQELLVKVGGSSLRYLIQLTSKNKTAVLLCEQMESLAANNELKYLEVESKTGTSAELNLDYVSLFKKASLEDAIGLLVKFRWTNPALSRELLPVKLQRCSLENRAYYLRQVGLNLSLDDEQFLIQELLADTNNECREVVGNLLRAIRSPQYSAMCLALCSKHLSFDGKYWHLQGLEYNAESDALGIIKLGLDLSQDDHCKRLLVSLLDSLTWEDLCKLAQSPKNDIPQTFYQWRKLNQSPDIPDYQNFHISAILGESISLTNNQQLIEDYIKFIGGDRDDLLDEDKPTSIVAILNPRLLMYLAPEKRFSFIGSIPDMREALELSYFVEHEGSLLDFKPMSERCSLNFAQGFLDRVQGHVFNTDVVLLSLYFNPKIISWCEQQRPKLQSAITEYEQIYEQISDYSAQYSTLIQKCRYQKKLDFIDRLQNFVQIKQNMSQVIEQERGRMLGQAGIFNMS